MRRKTFGILAAVAAVFTLTAGAETTEERIAALEAQMKKANAELADLKGERIDMAPSAAPESKLTFGGYGEIHANFTESGGDLLDIHRLVLYTGYEFADWLRLTSEVELEHASTDEEYLLVEQLYADALLSDLLNIRAGRMLAPMGIVNRDHEPVLFNGVERPNVDKYIIPSTWSVDGAGFFGYPAGWLSYEIYAVAGLDNSGFSAKEGVRGGRMKGRPGIDDPAVTGRMDIFPVVTESQNLRLGISGYYGGTNNKNKGGDSSSGVNNKFGLYSADFEYDLSRFGFRGEIAHGTHSDADKLAAGVGEEIFGWYLEGGVDVLPASWKKGRLTESELIPFVRYERYDTQYKLPNGQTATGEYDRTDVTVGISWLLTQNFVVKADAQFMRNERDGWDAPDTYNFGIGWVFK